LLPPKQAGNSDTEALLARKPSAEEVIDHLVEKRGFYFHGNVKRKDAWKPDEQGPAEALALLTVGIAQQIAQEAAAPIFDNAFAKRHFQDAMNAGASIVFEVRFHFREPMEKFSRDGMLRIKTPGTRVTGKQANAIAQHSCSNSTMTRRSRLWNARPASSKPAAKGLRPRVSHRRPNPDGWL
jgi:hypothetical protein